MERGTCKLCLLEKDLQDSHFLGRSIYKAFSLPDSPPVMLTADVAQQSTEQLRDYVFCYDCEQKFNSGGEKWMHPRIATLTDFKLLGLFSGQLPLFAESGYKLFDGTKVPGVDCAALLHYGAGMFFKAAAHTWDFKGVPFGIDIGKYMEPLRKFVHDGVELPDDVLISVGISGKQPLFIGFLPPVQMQEADGVKYTFYVSGVLYTLRLGANLTEAERKMAFSSPSLKLIFLIDDLSDVGRDIMKQLVGKSKPTPKLEQFMKKHFPPKP
jgi:hypothetical protein